MRREFRPWFAVVNEGYDQGSSGGGIISEPGEDLCDDDGITYMYFSDEAEALDNDCHIFQNPGWYKYYESGEYEFYSTTRPTDVHGC